MLVDELLESLQLIFRQVRRGGDLAGASDFDGLALVAVQDHRLEASVVQVSLAPEDTAALRMQQARLN